MKKTIPGFASDIKPGKINVPGGSKHVKGTPNDLPPTSGSNGKRKTGGPALKPSKVKV